jgi:pimeloyl-ACP methyl ester carboxylesterase
MIRSQVIVVSVLLIAILSMGGCASAPKPAYIDPHSAITQSAAPLSQPDLDDWLRATSKQRPKGLFRFGAYDPSKTAVIFIHGINGAPTNFKWLLSQLDLTTIQPWVYTYSSHKDLAESADTLFSSLCDEQARNGPLSVVLVGYSIGGLVARDVALHAHDDTTCARVPMLITLSTPWNGHQGAAWSFPFTSLLPATWGDLIPGSVYLKHLFVREHSQERTLQDTVHFLLFSYGRPAGFGRSGDGVVSVASQLFSDAQRQAAAVYGFNLSHDSMLQDANVVRTVENLLELPD